MNNSNTLIDSLIASHILKGAALIKAFRAVDRADFVRKEYQNEAYEDYPLPIGCGQTISQPTTVVFMLERLDPQEGEKILDVGSGSGWTTALLAYIVGKQGSVHGVEIIPELVAFGKGNLTKYTFPHAYIKQAHPDTLGLPEHAPFDKILVSAAATELPQALLDLLKDGGRMVIPVRGAIWYIEKISATEIRKHEYPGFAFVPLVEKNIGV